MRLFLCQKLILPEFGLNFRILYFTSKTLYLIPSIVLCRENLKPCAPTPTPPPPPPPALPLPSPPQHHHRRQPSQNEIPLPLFSLLPVSNPKSARIMYWLSFRRCFQWIITLMLPFYSSPCTLCCSHLRPYWEQVMMNAPIIGNSSPHLARKQ